MASTLETTNNIIHTKIQSLQKIATIVQTYNIEPYYSKICEFLTELECIADNYEIKSIKILSDYFLLIKDYQNQDVKSLEIKNVYIANRDKYFANYQTLIKKENIIDRVNRYYNSLKNIINSITKSSNNFIEPDMTNIKTIFSTYENSTITRSVSNISYNKCNKCSREMKIIASLSEMICTYCGITENLCGTIFEDEQYYYQEGQRTKHGSYDPSKHCRFWIERIQAKETKDIPESVLDGVRRCIRHNKIRNFDDITCKDLREYLRQTRNSTYNEHIPLIRKIITGITPAQLTDQESQLISIYFDKVTRIYDRIKPASKNNVSYHPYFIYKIIEHILKVKSPNDYRNSKKRISNILSCIHLQARETLIENDKTWKQICSMIDEIEYKPTDKNEQFVYNF